MILIRRGDFMQGDVVQGSSRFVALQELAGDFLLTNARSEGNEGERVSRWSKCAVKGRV